MENLLTSLQRAARPTISLLALEHHHPFASTKLHCLQTEAHVCEQLGKSCTGQRSGWDSNPRPVAWECDVLTTMLRAIEYHDKAKWMCVNVDMRQYSDSVLPVWPQILKTRDCITSSAEISEACGHWVMKTADTFMWKCIQPLGYSRVAVIIHTSTDQMCNCSWCYCTHRNLDMNMNDWSHAYN